MSFLQVQLSPIIGLLSLYVASIELPTCTIFTMDIIGKKITVNIIVLDLYDNLFYLLFLQNLLSYIITLPTVHRKDASHKINHQRII